MSTDADWYLYILECGDYSLYTGITNNLEKRIKQHRLGKGAKYTRSHLPVRLVYFQKMESRSCASKMENKVKKLSRIKKLELIKNNEKTY